MDTAMAYTPEKTIYLCLAHMSEEGIEQKYVKEAFDTNWVVPLGPNVNGFEKDLEFFVGENKRVVALSAGTAAVHLALLACGVKPGDEVLVQSFTFCASSHPITYLGAMPVFVDSEADTWNMDPVLLEEAIQDRIEKTGKTPKAIVTVALYGMPYKVDEIMVVADRYGIPIIEDAAEGFGSRYDGRMLGTFGKYGVLSFNGNKMITTSGGGALVCRTEEQAKRTMFYATQARENAPHYQHECIGYNYRMSNICAGIGRGQMFVLDEHITRRRAIHRLYTELLKDMPGIEVQQNPSEDFNSNFWLTCILVDPEKAGFNREDVRLHLADENIETRPLWKPMHLQPVFKQSPFYGDGTSERLFDKGLCLPSGPTLTDDDICRVVDEISRLKLHI